MTVANTQPKIGSCTEAVATVAAFRQDAWAKQDPHIHNDWPTLTPEWRYDDTLRADYASYQDLGKVDLLAAKALLTLNHLQTIYHVQLPAMRQYEADNYYTNSHTVFTSSKGLRTQGCRGRRQSDTSYTLRTPEDTNEGITTAWEDVRNSLKTTVIRLTSDHTLPDGQTDCKIEHCTPFDSPLREWQYEAAWCKHGEWPARAQDHKIHARDTTGKLDSFST